MMGSRQIKNNLDTIKIPLAELKVNINSYGNYRNNPILKERMDIFKDEHIWEIIFLIEDECIKNSNTDKLDEYKEKLIDYIGFLLKFEWERSKSEVNPDYYFLVSFILAAVGAVDVIINYKASHSDIKSWGLI